MCSTNCALDSYDDDLIILSSVSNCGVELIARCSSLSICFSNQ